MPKGAKFLAGLRPYCFWPFSHLNPRLRPSEPLSFLLSILLAFRSEEEGSLQRGPKRKEVLTFFWPFSSLDHLDYTIALWLHSCSVLHYTIVCIIQSICNPS